MVKTDAEKTRRTIPSIFHDPEKVAAAVAQAKRTAQEKAVPLTLSRLADCLGVEGEELYTFLEGRGGGPAVREVRRQLRLVRQGCRTELLEAMMDKSYNGPGVILVGKQEFGLEEKPAGPVTVVFAGSERL